MGTHGAAIADFPPSEIFVLAVWAVPVGSLAGACCIVLVEAVAHCHVLLLHSPFHFDLQWSFSCFSLNSGATRTRRQNASKPMRKNVVVIMSCHKSISSHTHWVMLDDEPYKGARYG